MHSVNSPEVEAERLYVTQSGLAPRLRNSPELPPLVIWDVGLGAASNAMAVLRCFEREFAACASPAAGSAPAPLRAVRLVSFERDLDPLRLAARDAAFFPHLRHAAPHALLRASHWAHPSGLFSWEMLVGDFLETLAQAPAPNLVFHDPFSAKTDSPLWTAETFARIAACASAAPGGVQRGAELYTYSAATAVRVALLRAGYFVAEGVGTGPKSSTTVAFTHLEGLGRHPSPPRLLGAEWLARWSRSHAQFPPALPEAEREAFAHRILTHPQFARP
ncbi:MAG: methyltransferase [Verrucomicrobia bacterium]|nr:MAG: methyltransferase [Verrucomicrobiota bacterium]